MYLSDDIKKELVEKITITIKAQKIILFGSYAKGTVTEDSDIDLLIIENNIGSKMEEKRKIREILKDIKIPKDILVADEKKFDFYKNEPCSVYREANENGEVLWSI